MKKYVITIIILFCNYVAFSQNIEYTKTNLLLYKLENKKFTSVIDSIVSFSEQCEGSGLKLLNFSLSIQETQLNYYQIQVTMINCQDMNFLLTAKNNRNKVIGYFVYKNKNFIITGRGDLGEIFKPTDYKFCFTTFSSKYLLKIDYSVWNYSYYAADNKFEMISFNPICVSEKDRIFPICSDSIDLVKKKY